MCRVSKYGNVSKERSWKALRLWDSPFGCAASEGGASFVARRAVNLHGCALPHFAPPPTATPPDPPVVPPHFSYYGGTPGSVFRTRVGRVTSVLSSRYVAVFMKRSIRGLVKEGRFCDGF